jgi:N-acetyl sugar amidotransferase
MKNIQICSRCILDNTVPEITFDSEGVCQYCKIYDELDKLYPLDGTNTRLENLIDKIKKKRRGSSYDCIVGVSGGTDSTYTLMKVVQYGLRPLAVHFDNGWNSKLAVENIEKICTRLNVDLYTYVVDWEEFKDIQVSFLKASTCDAETPTDVGILGTLFRIASQKNISYILYGHSFRTEGVTPIGWSYYDGYYIKSVHKKFGKVKMKTFPNILWYHFLYYIYFKKINMVSFLNYVDYNKAEAKKILETELDWKYSGGHHHESIYTHFFQSFLLPRKFNIDKRKTEFSAMILSKHETRKNALEHIQSTSYPYEQDIVDYTLKKLDISQDEFERILKLPIKTFRDYPSYLSIIRLFKPLIHVLHKARLLPGIIYLKYKSILD